MVDRDGVQLNPGSKNVREAVSRSLFEAWRSTIDAIDLGSCESHRLSLVLARDTPRERRFVP